MTIEELFGTLQQSVVSSWRKHLRTAKYSKHEALDEFYKEMPEKVDALIEAWMGAHGKKVKSYDNLLTASNMNTLKYLGELKKVCKEGYELMGDNDELKSLLDDIINLINSTLYKVKELSESSIISLSDYVMESIINESLSKSDFEELKDYFYSTIDYLYQEGVSDYTDDKLQAYCDDNDLIKYAELVDDALATNIATMPNKYQKLLKRYNDNNTDIKDVIVAAINSFVNDEI